MALDSLGFGIGLQAQPKDYAGIAQQALATRSARQKAEAAAKARNDEEFNKLITSKDFIQQSGNFHKLYRGAAAKEISDFMNRAIQTRKDNPNDYLGQVVSDFQQTQLKLNSYKQNSEKVKAYEKAAFDPKLNASTWFDPNFTSSVINESYESPNDWYKVKFNPGLGVSFNPQTGDFDAQPPMKVTDDDVIKDLSDVKNMQEVSATMTTTPGGGGQFKTAKVVSEVRPEVVENRARMWSSNPDYVTSKAIEAGLDMSDPNWYNTAKDLAYQNVKSLAGKQKTDLSIMTVPGSGATTTLPQTPTVIPINIPEKIRVVAPQSFIKSGGLGAKANDNWTELTRKIDAATKAGVKDDVDKLTEQRTSQAKERVRLLNGVLIRKGIATPKAVTDFLAKGTITETDIASVDKVVRGNSITSDELSNYFMEGKGLSEQERVATMNWILGSTSIATGGRTAIQTVNVDDTSRVKNSPQDWTVEVDGKNKLVQGTINKIYNYDTGETEVSIVVNGKEKLYKLTDDLRDQIAKKGYPQISQIKFQ